MSNICIGVEFLPGTKLEDALIEAKYKCVEWDVAWVKFKFNDKSFSVGPRLRDIDKYVFKFHNDHTTKRFICND